MDGDLVSKLQHARALRIQREAQIAELENSVYKWLESCASSHHHTSRRASQLWQVVTTNPLRNPVIQTHVKSLASAVYRVCFPDTMDAATKGISSDEICKRGDADDSGGEVVTMTKIQFLEQQLAELRTLMASQAISSADPAVSEEAISAAGSSLTAPDAGSNEAIAQVLSVLASDPAPAMGSSSSNPSELRAADTAASLSSPAPDAGQDNSSLAALLDMAPQTARAFPSEATTTGNPESAAEPSTPAPSPPSARRPSIPPVDTAPPPAAFKRPSMVDIVKQASSIQLRHVDSETPNPPSTPEAKGLEGMLKSALHKRFGTLHTQDSDSDSDFDSPFTPVSSGNKSKKSEVKSAVAPRRRSLLPGIESAEGVTTASISKVSAEAPPSVHTAGASLNKSLPPAIGGGSNPDLLAAIRAHKKETLTPATKDSNPGQFLTPVAASARDSKQTAQAASDCTEEEPSKLASATPSRHTPGRSSTPVADGPFSPAARPPRPAIAGVLSGIKDFKKSALRKVGGTDATSAPLSPKPTNAGARTAPTPPPKRGKPASLLDELKGVTLRRGSRPARVISEQEN